MPLIQCPDCQKQISDAAPTCPGCGRPMKAAPAPLPFGAPGSGVMPAGGPKPVVIEQTSKKLKLQVLLSVVCVLLSVVILVAGLGTQTTWISILGGLVFLGGLGWFIATRVLIWWQHE